MTIHEYSARRGGPRIGGAAPPKSGHRSIRGAPAIRGTASILLLTSVGSGGPATAAGEMAPAGRGVADLAAIATADIRFADIELATGVRLRYAEAGPADGEPVLFLHGYTDSWFSFSPVLDRLPAGIRAIVPSQRGHGDSERPACCYLIADFAADAVALLDALGVDRATVVGHSMGSFVAQRVAIDHPDRVSRLVLVGSGTTVRTEPVVAFNDVVQTLGDTALDVSFIRDFQASTAFRPLPPQFLDRVVAESSRLPARVWRDALAGLLAADAEGELHRIRAPTLIIWGEQDTFFVRSEQDGLVRAIPDATLLAYPAVAHCPHWERPDRFAADLAAFLASRDGGTDDG